MRSILPIGLLVLLLVNAGSVAAQQPGRDRGAGRGRDTGMGPRATALLRGITLTAEQQQRVDSIDRSHAEQRDAMRGAMPRGAGRDTAMMAHRDSMQAQYIGALRSVLTADQRPRFDSNVVRMRGMRPGGMRESGRGMRDRPPGRGPSAR